MKNIERYFNVLNRALFRIDSNLEYDRIIEGFIKLANAIAEYEGETESIWYLGEYTECTLDEMIIGAYWHFVHWSGGQASMTYAAQCALGCVYQPNMECEDEDNAAYQMLNEMAEKQAA